MESFNTLSIINNGDRLLIENDLFTVQKSGVILKLHSDYSHNTMNLPKNKKVNLSLISTNADGIKNYKLH